MAGNGVLQLLALIFIVQLVTFSSQQVARTASKPVASKSRPRSPVRTPPAKPIVSIGYGTRYTFNVRNASGDALEYFKNATDALSGGGTLKIGPGIFFLSRNWNITASNLLIQGAGMHKTILKLMDWAPTFKNGGLIYSISTSTVTMLDMSIDGNRLNQNNTNDDTKYGRYCIFIVTYKNWKFQRVECRNFQLYGFDPHGMKERKIDINGTKLYNSTSEKNTWSYGLSILDCVSHDNGLDGFTIDMTVGVLVRNNTAYNNDRHGFNVVTASSNVMVENNRAWNNGLNPRNGFGCGLLADTNKPGFVTNRVTFRNNIIRTQVGGVGGACVKGAKNVLFINNTISNSITCATFMNVDRTTRFINNTCRMNLEGIVYKPPATNQTMEATLSRNIIINPPPAPPALTPALSIQSYFLPPPVVVADPVTTSTTTVVADPVTTSTTTGVADPVTTSTTTVGVDPVTIPTPTVVVDTVATSTPPVVVVDPISVSPSLVSISDVAIAAPPPAMIDLTLPTPTP